MLHSFELGQSRGPVVHTDGHHAKRAVGDEVSDIDGSTTIEASEVLVDGAKTPVEAWRVVVPPGELTAELVHELRRRGGGTEAVLTDDVERDPLPHFAVVLRVHEKLHVGMGVHVDEPGAYEESVGID